MLGWTSLITKHPPEAPRLNERRARFVLAKLEEILAWERDAQNTRDAKFVELGRYLCEVRAGQYWRYENLHSFDEFLASHFPDSRRKAYYLMSIHESLPRGVGKHLKQIGWTKAVELAKLARRQRQGFDCATWLHKAESLTKDDFRNEIARALGDEAEASDMMYFKLYKSQLSIVEQALDMAARLLGSDRSRGYCLELVCADFLAGVAAAEDTPELLLTALLRTFALLAPEAQRRFLEKVRDGLQAAA